MKKLFLISLIFFAHTCYSQYQIGIDGGISLKIKPSAFREEWKNGITLGVNAGYTFSQYFNLSVRLDYTMNKYNKDIDIWNNYILDGGDIRIITPSVGLKYLPFSNDKSVNLFLLFSLGYEFLSQDDTRIKADNYGYTVKGRDVGGLGSQIGIGLEVPFSNKFSFVLNAEYNFMYTKINKLQSLQTIPIKTGICFYL